MAEREHASGQIQPVRRGARADRRHERVAQALRRVPQERHLVRVLRRIRNLRRPHEGSAGRVGERHRGVRSRRLNRVEQRRRAGPERQGTWSVALADVAEECGCDRVAERVRPHRDEPDRSELLVDRQLAGGAAVGAVQEAGGALLAAVQCER